MLQATPSSMPDLQQKSARAVAPFEAGPQSQGHKKLASKIPEA